MPRRPTLSPHSPASTGARSRVGLVWRASLVLVLVLSMAGLPDEARAQQTPDSFTLPEGQPTSSPTPPPQGPEDERSGVPIGPRPISPDPRQPAPTPAPAATPTSAPAPATQPASPVGEEQALDDPFSDAFPTLEPQDQVRSGAPVSGPQTLALPATSPPAESTRAQPERARTASPVSSEPPQRAQSEQAAETSRDSEPVREGDWVTLDRGAPLNLPPAPVAQRPSFLADPSYYSAWFWALLGLALLAVGVVIGRALQGRRDEVAEDGQVLTSSARKEIEAAYDIGSADQATPVPEGLKIDTLKKALAEAMKNDREEAIVPSLQPAESARPEVAPTATVEPPEMALSLAITSARRSLMMFTVEYRLTLANRSDKAVRDLKVHGRLACAKSDEAGSSNPLLNRELAAVERIGPHQSHTISGALELAIADVRLMRQGNLPVFVPLLHVSVEIGGVTAKTERFVVGAPSENHPARLHPIVVDSRIGGIAGLRATRVAAPAPEATL
ncbi:MAG: hypothetical protein AAF291_03075 [Pseudomonadota bacterium]